MSVQVPAGSIYGFLGPNGAGKTTTIRMIMNIIRPDKGSVRIFGDGITTQAKTRIGYMPEERGLYRKMKVSKVLEYFGAIKGMKASELGQRVIIGIVIFINSLTQRSITGPRPALCKIEGFYAEFLFIPTLLPNQP